MSAPIILDIGCGHCCRPGTIGLDAVAQPGVSVVCDLIRDRWPFNDRSVDGIFSSHFLEHFDHNGHLLHHVLSEIGRVCKDGASIEIWTPHARGEGGFLAGHVSYITETFWRHVCVLFRECWRPSLNGAWQWHECRFQVQARTIDRCKASGIEMPFALLHLWQVIEQCGIFATYVANPETVTAEEPRITYAVDGRDCNLNDITSEWVW